ncbi:MAG TPA: thrombospondin type 3 repeat-containing protein, partial [Anaerolineaceae bacterium]|nr:thrombospondin type 3 repeat-containing protein [Anaerolineaceae bacterium]
MFRNRKLLLFINRALYIGAAAMMIAGLVLTVAPQPVAAGGAGAIWTTKGGCSSDSQQDVNHYLAGDWIYIKGSGFTANTTLPWTITGNPGGASADPEIIVAQNPPLISTDTNGNFCIQAYQVKNDDRGEYTVDVPGASKNDNYRITDDLCPTINGKQKTDTDNDGIGDACDNCPAVANSTQTDTDGDGIGDACEVTPPTDLCPDLDGIQETYPYDGSCTPPPTDLCPDLDGIQETYPYDGS